MNDVSVVSKKLIICCLLLLHSQISSAKRSTPAPPSPWHYIDNWDKYNLPKPVHERDLAKILVQIARYKKLKYCPFDDLDDCLRLSTDDVIKKIVEQNLKYSGDFYKPKPMSDCDREREADMEKSQRIPYFGSRGALNEIKKRRG